LTGNSRFRFGAYGLAGFGAYKLGCTGFHYGLSTPSCPTQQQVTCSGKCDLDDIITSSKGNHREVSPTRSSSCFDEIPGQHATTFQNSDERALSRRQETDGERSPLRLLCTTLCRTLAQRSISTNTRYAAHFMKYEILWQGNPISVVKTFGKTPPVLCATENKWRL
jgi:hypothetical protein